MNQTTLDPFVTEATAEPTIAIAKSLTPLITTKWCLHCSHHRDDHLRDNGKPRLDPCLPKCCYRQCSCGNFSPTITSIQEDFKCRFCDKIFDNLEQQIECLDRHHYEAIAEWKIENGREYLPYLVIKEI